MQKEVNITIEGYQSTSDEKIINNVYGMYYLKNNAHYIKYDEVDGEHITKVMLKIKEDTVRLERKGVINTVMNFLISERKEIKYSTAYHETIFELFTHHIDCDIQEEEICIVIKYELSANGEKVSDNHIKILIQNR